MTITDSILGNIRNISSDILCQFLQTFSDMPIKYILILLCVWVFSFYNNVENRR